MTLAGDLWAGPGWLAGIAAACIAAVALALVAQHGFDMQPCPWCILQRLIYLLIALLCGVATMLKGGTARVVAVVLALALAVSGVAAAVFQHVVAAKSFSCNLTLADTIITALGLESLVPALFKVTATCADAAVSVLGVPFEYWSLTLFAVIALALVAWLARGAGASAARSQNVLR